MSRETECIIWCPACQIDLFEVVREPTRNEHVYQNRMVNLTLHADHKTCGDCGEGLQRK